LRDTTTYSAANTLSPVRPPCPRAAAALRDGGFRSVPTLTNADPPTHTRARRIANAGFTPAWSCGWRTPSARWSPAWSRSACAGGAPTSSVVRALTWELPALAIFKLLGVPDDVPRVKAWDGNRLLFLFGRLDPDQQVRVAAGMAAFWRYTEELAVGRRKRPRDDVTSELVHALDLDGRPLTQQEESTILFGILLAGHETTTHLLTNGLRRLLEQRAAWEALCAEPALIPNAIEEVLRYDPPNTIWRRKTRVPCRVRGVQVPAGANLLLVIAAANRDPEAFVEPDRLEVRRANARDHLSFGGGNHLCLGAPLAFHPNIAFRGPTSLRVEWDPSHP
jgi:cytochrome P450